jgi:iron complex transport system ATP-binding protein
MNSPSGKTKTIAYSISHLTFGYGTPWVQTRDAVLSDLTCTIESGQIVGVLGPNGSGKSTLLKLLTRILRLRVGTIELFGRDLHALRQADIARTVAFVPQETQQSFPFTLAQMVLMGRYPHHSGWGGWHWENSADLAVAHSAMIDLDVAHLGTRLITDVSGGERQRAIIARAIAQVPNVLLLDEPTAFLDLHHQLEIARILRKLNRERGLTVIMVSHDLNLASQYCDHLILLDRGRMVKEGSPEEVIEPEILEAVYRCRVLVDRHPQSGMPRVSLPV